MFSDIAGKLVQKNYTKFQNTQGGQHNLSC